MEYKSVSSLALLDEIKVLANTQDEIKVESSTKNKKKTTVELNFALDDIKNSIHQAATTEQAQIKSLKEVELEQREFERKKNEQLEALKISSEIALAQANQEKTDQERHINQLRLQYQAALSLNPNASKPKELQEIDDAQAKVQAQIDAKIAQDQMLFQKAEQDRIATIARQKIEHQAKRMKKLYLSASILSMTAVAVFFLVPKSQPPVMEIAKPAVMAPVEKVEKTVAPIEVEKTIVEVKTVVADVVSTSPKPKVKVTIKPKVEPKVEKKNISFEGDDVTNYTKK